MIEVSAGIVISHGKILCTQRGEAKYPYLSYKYEFPGGKSEPGESSLQALVREFKEELEAIVNESETTFFCDTIYNYPDFSVKLHSFVIEDDHFSFSLTEHVSYKWLDVGQLDDVDWAEADKEIVVALKEYLK